MSVDVHIYYTMHVIRIISRLKGCKEICPRRENVARTYKPTFVQTFASISRLIDSINGELTVQSSTKRRRFTLEGRAVILSSDTFMTGEPLQPVLTAS